MIPNMLYHYRLTLVLITVALLSIATPLHAFTITPARCCSALFTKQCTTTQIPRIINTHLFEASSDEEKENKVAIGSSEYYQGFVGRSLNEEPEERVTGDAILGPTFKFVGGFAAILVVLTVGFLASNGLI